MFKCQGLKCRPITHFLCLVGPKTSFISQKVSLGMSPGRKFLWSRWLNCITLKWAKEIALIKVSYSTTPPLNHLSLTMQHIFQCLFSRKTTLKTLGRSQNVFLKVPASGSVLAYPKLAPFSVNMPKPHCCCYAAQQGSLKKNHIIQQKP